MGFLDVAKAAVVDFPDVSPIDSAVRQPRLTSVAEIFVWRRLAFDQKRIVHISCDHTSSSSFVLDRMASALWIGLGVAGAAFFVCTTPEARNAYTPSSVPSPPGGRYTVARNRYNANMCTTSGSRRSCCATEVERRHRLARPSILQRRL